MPKNPFRLRRVFGCAPKEEDDERESRQTPEDVARKHERQKREQRRPIGVIGILHEEIQHVDADLIENAKE